MTSQMHAVDPADRRSFLKQCSAAAVAGMAVGQTRAAADEAPSAPPKLPMITLGEHRISRLVVGSNTVLGYSYMGAHADRHMREYFTVEQTVQFLKQCEAAGINAFQFAARDDMLAALAESDRQGSKLKRICLHSDPQSLAQMVQQTKPIAVVHHGGATDRLFAQGRAGEVHDFVKAAHDAGVLAGVSAHNPDCIKQVADEGWEVDLFMTCFYFLTRALVPERKDEVVDLPTLEISYPFFRNDPQVMTQVIRQVDQPCLAFKILGSGRLCTSPTSVRTAFQFAFEHIKPIDGVIIGMYPRFFDEIQANAEYTREFGSTTPRETE
jgi:hypothetical protein